MHHCARGAMVVSGVGRRVSLSEAKCTGSGAGGGMVHFTCVQCTLRGAELSSLKRLAPVAWTPVFTGVCGSGGTVGIDCRAG